MTKGDASAVINVAEAAALLKPVKAALPVFQAICAPAYARIGFCAQNLAAP
jgi:hypothetical protein